MVDKYSVRDFFAYFLVGLFLLLTLLYQFKILLYNYFSISIEDVKSTPSIVIFLLIPSLYLLGHIVHSIDSIIGRIGNYIEEKSTKHKFVIFLFKCVNGNRLLGNLKSEEIDFPFFNEKVNKLQFEDKYRQLEYWNLMNELFKGLTLISFSWMLFYIINFSSLKFFIALVLTFLFWYRARFMAKKYILLVNNTYDLIK
ncbi:hypothetical protein [Cytophaga hutchinsonii]|uniref:Uncharacterized protein n=1 Tax=Cytophaga hutchinsonii (strain ATCC 33406 / DSM 1761 / CIP 103989 / NBRC 15051 / NCIMB 9469 / D465) TaxID=269798 RepID=A0A6N4SNP3_CYTH3|nr:hypothetical protein [Cytophaga hutchinsonii]ABG57931.1 hypothetical protein CHU_0644 [Cytophaga hutchinsonii ATCC 33406]SFX09330.1 hypothetical protein SAMN04487930_101485 [Cytophaga hutchinsonii ATCC 33406]